MASRSSASGLGGRATVDGEGVMTRSRTKVLFVCTGNSARSQMAEAILRARAGDDFEVFSAGVDPRGINPLTLRVLGDARISTEGLRSKSVNEMLNRQFDYVI